MAEVLADLLERPATAPPAGDERAGAAVTEVVPADRAGDARGGEVAVEEVDLLLLPAAGAGREGDHLAADERRLALGDAAAPGAGEDEGLGVVGGVAGEEGEPAAADVDGVGGEVDAADLAVLGGLVLRAEADHDVRGVGVEAEVGELEVELLALAEAGEEGEEDDQAVGLRDGVAGAEAVLFLRLEVGPRLDGGVAGAALGGLLDALLEGGHGIRGDVLGHGIVEHLPEQPDDLLDRGGGERFGRAVGCCGQLLLEGAYPGVDVARRDHDKCHVGEWGVLDMRPPASTVGRDAADAVKPLSAVEPLLAPGSEGDAGDIAGARIDGGAQLLGLLPGAAGADPAAFAVDGDADQMPAFALLAHAALRVARRASSARPWHGPASAETLRVEPRRERAGGPGAGAPARDRWLRPRSCARRRGGDARARGA
ncbi:hypothetical protein WME81_18825 [Sorangium sp. So ce1078]